MFGEFGVPLTRRGNIPANTRGVAVHIYEYVVAMEDTETHWLAGGMLIFSFIVLWLMYTLNPSTARKRTLV